MPPETGVKVSAAVQRALSHESNCVPDGAVLLSVVNEYHTPLHGLQMLGVHKLGCLAKRIVLLCFGTDVPHGTCVHTAAVPKSDFRESQFQHIAWAKWGFVFYALQVQTARARVFLAANH